jgi:hypothetical protein
MLTCSSSSAADRLAMVFGAKIRGRCAGALGVGGAVRRPLSYWLFEVSNFEEPSYSR